MVGSLTKAHSFGSIEEDEECEYDHKLIDDSSAKVATRTIVPLEKTIQTCARMF
jgi:hypothetical protein